MKIFATRLLLITLSIALGWSSDSYGQSETARDISVSMASTLQRKPMGRNATTTMNLVRDINIAT
jgi:hypothetical protein